jgi:hypothetical protein
MELSHGIRNAIDWTGKHLKDMMVSAGLRNPEFLPDTSPAERDIIRAARPYTMTSIRHLEFLLRGVGYLHQNAIAGDIVECGVWKGGCIIAAGRQNDLLGDQSRSFWLFDTFGGMPSPSERDGEIEREFYQRHAAGDGLSGLVSMRRNGCAREPAARVQSARAPTSLREGLGGGDPPGIQESARQDRAAPPRYGLV